MKVRPIFWELLIATFLIAYFLIGYMVISLWSIGEPGYKGFSLKFLIGLLIWPLYYPLKWLR
jgi:hypothetical protein